VIFLDVPLQSISILGIATAIRTFKKNVESLVFSIPKGLGEENNVDMDGTLDDRRLGINTSANVDYMCDSIPEDSGGQVQFLSRDSVPPPGLLNSFKAPRQLVQAGQGRVAWKSVALLLFSLLGPFVFTVWWLQTHPGDFRKAALSATLLLGAAVLCMGWRRV